MDTESTESNQQLSWQRLVDDAKQVEPPGDIPILPALHLAIEKERNRSVEEPASLWAEIGRLTDMTWMRTAAATLAAAVILMGQQAVAVWSELSLVFDLHIPGLSIFL